jgi:methyl-accepting chemotaxis protein
MQNAALPTPEVFEAVASRAVEGLSIWADANQRVFRQLVDLSAAAAAETVRLQTELHSAVLSAARTGQEFLAAQPARLQAAQKDPIGAYQKAVAETVENVQQAIKLLEVNADTVAQSAGRIQESAQKTGKDIQSTVLGAATRLTTLYAPAEAKVAEPNSK